MMQLLWPVPFEVVQFPEAANVNPVLARAFSAIRAALDDDAGRPFFASPDDLLDRIELPEFRQLVQFIAASAQGLAKQANAQSWPEGRLSLDLRFAGCWFQIQNGQAFHDIHTHGNCSWSGVYYVQVDPAEERQRHTTLGELNGATRFYGPYSQLQGGAYMDMGNAYLQKNSIDIQPEEGRLVLFPSWLAHKAMAYEGRRDRIIISFNLQIHSRSGNQVYGYAAA